MPGSGMVENPETSSKSLRGGAPQVAADAKLPLETLAEA